MPDNSVAIQGSLEPYENLEPEAAIGLLKRGMQNLGNFCSNAAFRPVYATKLTRKFINELDQKEIRN